MAPSPARRAPLLLAIAFASAAIASCGGGGPGSQCPGTGRSLEILAPADGDRVGTSDVEITVLACRFDLADSIVVRVVAPFESEYAFLRPTGPESVLTTTADFVPGTISFLAQSMD